MSAFRLPGFKAPVTLRKLTGAEFDRIQELGILTDLGTVELLEGYLVLRLPVGPAHGSATVALYRRLDRMVPDGWLTRSQHELRLSDSRPEPDVAVVRGSERDFAARPPVASQVGLVVEVSDSSLDRDQQDKFRIYARDRIPVYWVVNLVDRRVEVYTDPNGPGDDPRYHTLRVFPAGAAVPVELDGTAVGTIPVNDLLP